MKTLTFVVKEPRRPDVVIDVKADRILLGSGAHCDIRLPLECAAWEHLVITIENDRVIARVIPTDSIAFFDGEAKRQTELDPGAVIRIDSVDVELRSYVDREAKAEKQSPLRTAVLLAGLTVAAAGLLVLKNASASGTPPPPPPPDPVGHRATACPEKQGALPLAHQKLALARSMRERSRFYPREGAVSFALYQTAALCFTDGQDYARAEQALAEAEDVQREVRDEFHASRVRLERALVRRDGRVALGQVKLQRDILRGNPQADAYVTWLALLQSKLETIVATEEK
jgi:hypothetical protein